MLKFTSMSQFAAVILAGGKGSRMRSELPKVLHQVAGVPMVLRNIEKLKSIGLTDFTIVVGYKAEEVKDVVAAEHEVRFALQETPLGTNHALETAMKVLPTDSFDHVFVINGDDAALYQPETLKKYLQSHIDAQAVVSIMTLNLEGEHELGKIFRDKNGEFKNTLEKFEYEHLDVQSTEINCGVYIYDAQWVAENVTKVLPNGKGEYPITDLMKMAKEQGEKVNLFVLEDAKEWAGVNTPEELHVVNQYVQEMNGFFATA